MATHIRPTTPPPTRIRVATANASAAPLTGGLLAASAVTAGAADSVTHHKADFNGEGDGFGRVSAYGDINGHGYPPFGANAAN
ncbi:hypothetical protein [Streptomyces endophyticus]|uniref:Uncharacterized protein n=1 Tax=Streptomyces endophyticus TaxID=714166 RepID=A0ABU6F810_9ACTN|nr:hypothetical protein [Streptomyces endophyticus]MEB8339613.1 hypothetical protein [Streptomyces endophyticus]